MNEQQLQAALFALSERVRLLEAKEWDRVEYVAHRVTGQAFTYQRSEANPGYAELVSLDDPNNTWILGTLEHIHAHYQPLHKGTVESIRNEKTR